METKAIDQERFSRQLLLPEIGIAGQQQLAQDIFKGEIYPVGRCIPFEEVVLH